MDDGRASPDIQGLKSLWDWADRRPAWAL